MKKRFVLLLFFMVCSNLAQARMFNFGPRIGISYAQLKIRNKKNREKFSIDDKFGYQLGGFARLNIFILYVQPELSITGSRARVKSTEAEQEVTLSFTKLDAPVMLGITFLNLSILKLRAHLGPAFSLLFRAVHKGEDNPAYEKITLGYKLGAGVDLWNLVFRLEYGGNLSGFGKKILGVDTDHRLKQFIFSIGIKVLR